MGGKPGEQLSWKPGDGRVEGAEAAGWTGKTGQELPTRLLTGRHCGSGQERFHAWAGGSGSGGWPKKPQWTRWSGFK